MYYNKKANSTQARNNFVTLFSKKVKNKLKTNQAENSWNFKNNQPQPKIDWF